MSDSDFEAVKAIIAVGGNSRAARSARVRRQLRDSKGRWIFMGGHLSSKVRLPNGKVVRIYGQNLGSSDAKPGYAQVYMQGQEGFEDGFYLTKGDKGNVYKAILSPEQLKSQGIEVKDAGSSKNLQDFNDIIKIDAPEGWTKNDDGSFSTEDGEFTIGKDANGKFSLTQNDNKIAEYDNIGEAFVEAADIDAESALSGPEADKVAELRQKGKKYAEDFAKTTNPAAMDNIEKKIEQNDEAIKDIVRNKPVATLTEEQAQGVENLPEATPAEGPQPGDIFELKNLDSAPNGTTIDYKHTIKSADGNDKTIETTYQKNDQGDWMNLDNDTKATVQLRNQANDPEGHVGEYRYAEAPKAEQVAELPAAPEAPVENPKDKFGNDVPEGWTRGEENTKEFWTNEDGSYTITPTTNYVKGKPVRSYVVKDNKDFQKFVESVKTWDDVAPFIQKREDFKTEDKQKQADLVKTNEAKAAKAAEDAAYLKSISSQNDAITRAKNAVAPYDDADGTLAKMIDDGASGNDILSKMDEISPEYSKFRSDAAFEHTKEFLTPEDKKNDAKLAAISEAVRAPEKEKAAQTPEATLPEAPEATTATTVTDLSDWKKVGGQAGSNEGGLYESPTGERAYVKFQDTEHANNEILASKLYALAGTKTAQVNKGTLDGKDVTYSPIVEGQQGFADKLNDEQFMSKLRDGFAADAWLANWDVAGLNFDNVVVDSNNEPVRIDQGGALQFRAQGEPKGDKFDDKASEVSTLLDPNTNPQSAQVFDGMTAQEEKASAILVANVQDSQIADAVKEVYGDTPEAQDLTNKLIARKKNVVASLTEPEKNAPEARLPEALTPEIVNADFFKEDGSLNEDVVKEINDKLGPISTPEPAPAANPEPMPLTKNFQDWNAWAESAPVGTELFQPSPNGSDILFTKKSDNEWDATKDGQYITTIDNGFLAAQAMDNDFSPEEKQPLPEAPAQAEAAPVEPDFEPAIPAQMHSIDLYMQTKDIPEADLTEITNEMYKATFSKQEGFDLIDKLAGYPNIKEATLKPKSDAPTINQEANNNPELTPKSSQDILNPDLIMAQVKADYPDHTELSSSDIKIAEREFTKDGGKSFKYELIVRRTSSNRFFSYVRETDLQTNKVRVWKASPENHSYEALSNKFAAAKNQIVNGKDPRNWFQKKSGIENVPDGLDVAKFNQSVSGEFKFPVSQDDNKNKLVDAVKGLLQDDSASKVVVDALAKMGNVDQSFADELYEAVIEHQVKKKSSSDILKEEVFADTHVPHLAFDGVTEVKVGSVVDWTDNKKGSPTYGQVFRGVVQKVIPNDISKGYGYTDYVEVIFPEYNKLNGYAPTHWRKRTTPALNVVTGQESKPSTPFVQKAKEAQTQEKIIQDLPQGDTAVITPKPKTDKKPVDAKITADNLGNTTIETPGGEISVPVTVQQAAETLTNPGVSELSITPNQVQPGDVIFLGSDITNGARTVATVLSVEKSSLGDTVIWHSVMPEPGKGLLPTNSKTSFGPGIADTIKVKVRRVDSLTNKNSTGIPTESKETTTNDAAALANNIAEAIDASPATSTVDTQGLKDLTTDAVAADPSLPKYSDIIGGNKVKQIEMGNVVFGKKNSPFANIQSIPVNKLQVGDLVKDGVGSKMRYYQILDIEPDGASYGATAITYRIISENPAYNGKVFTRGWSPYNTKKNIKRPTEANKDYVIAVPGGEQSSGDPISQTKNSSLTTVDVPENITTAAQTVSSDEYLTNFGLSQEIEPGVTFTSVLGYGNSPENLLSSAASDELFWIGASGTKNAQSLPGTVVKSQDKGSFGVIKSQDKPSATVEVSWLTGSKAGYDEKLLGGNVLGTDKWLTSDEASKFGVNYDTAPQENITKALDEKVSGLKAKAAEKIKAQKDIELINSMKDKNTVSGTGTETITPQEVLAWDQSDFEGVNSLQEAIETVQSGNGGIFGRQVPIDSGEIEDSKVRVSRVKNLDGTYSTRLEFKLTDWTANSTADHTGLTELAMNTPGTQTFGSIRVPKYKTDREGNVLQTGTTIPNKAATSAQGIDGYQTGETYKVPILGADGKEIGHYLLHRANKDAKPVNFQFSGSVNGHNQALSYHNSVDIYLDQNASAQDIEYALSKVGVSAARPATKADVQVLAENKIIDIFGNKQNGAKNYSGELRQKILSDFEEKYGVSASDAQYIQEDSDLFLLMPEEFGQKVADQTGISIFRHNWTRSKNEGETTQDRAQFIFDFLTKTKLRPTTQRWNHGLNYSGMSSNADGNGHGADYIFTRVGEESYGKSDMGMEFRANMLLRRLDYFQNGNDAWGKKVAGTQVVDNLSGATEVLFKGTISWSDLSQISIKDPKERALVLEMLLNAGVKDFGGTPVDEVIK